LLFAPEGFALEAETSAFTATDFELVALPAPTIFAPASTAPVTAPLAAPDAAPLITLVKMSVAWLTKPLGCLFTVFFLRGMPLTKPLSLRAQLS